MTDKELTRFLRTISILKTKHPEFYDCLRDCIDTLESYLILLKLLNQDPKPFIIPPCDFYN